MVRRLAAILAADVVGYSTLMAEDEVGTLALLKAHREALFNPETARHGGRIVKLMGDGTLVEFASVIAAVECAVTIQQTLAVADSPIRLRIGINLGDILIEDNDIYGDGVNVAARLEAMAEPGGICISGQVFDSIEGKLALTFDDIGLQQIKNIARPVRVWRWSPGAAASPLQMPKRPALPDRPSIAVLPFTNMSGDPEQEYFSDGITEDIITELARFNSLFVIARNSSFHYKGKSPRIEDVGRELGVRYVVEGSVRKAGNRVRITAQLIEAATENHLWAERYDRELEDIFAVQDEVVREIATTVPGRVDADELSRVLSRPTENATAYDCFLRAERLRHQVWGSLEARAMLEQAIAANPQFARAHAHLSNWHAYAILGHQVPYEEGRHLTNEHAEIAFATTTNDSVSLALIAEGYVMAGKLELARRAIERAIKFNANNYLVMLYAAVTLTWLGDPEAGLYWHDQFVRHDPVSVDASREVSAEVHFMNRNFDSAIRVVEGWHEPPTHVLACIAAANAQAGRQQEAALWRERYLRRPQPGYDFRHHAEAVSRMCALQEHRELWLEGYRKAGFRF